MPTLHHMIPQHEQTRAMPQGGRDLLRTLYMVPLRPAKNTQLLPTHIYETPMPAIP